MAEAVAIVNSRPISSISSDANDPAFLTPNMLLTQKTSPLRPFTDEFTRQDIYGRKRWRQENVSTGDVVLLKEKDVIRGSWPLARVVRTHESEDGKVRKMDVLVRTEGTRRNFTRPISELVLIERANTSP
ncbi:hypothetical protein HOLleu_15543 [Holothuria leucospilota]|uniref:DUF5641 domain-containing protein n=1 Tax=Holothuria leucospilota TaxID=206669 RepID=A0A9Q1C4R6_HOLLE|nr:hypothetical protein HOLleu_15543 [Holothuria leucospilota]